MIVTRIFVVVKKKLLKKLKTFFFTVCIHFDVQFCHGKDKLFKLLSLMNLYFLDVCISRFEKAFVVCFQNSILRAIQRSDIQFL